jgi:hypothetical protein
LNSREFAEFGRAAKVKPCKSNAHVAQVEPRQISLAVAGSQKTNTAVERPLSRLARNNLVPALTSERERGGP